MEDKLHRVYEHPSWQQWSCEKQDQQEESQYQEKAYVSQFGSRLDLFILLHRYLTNKGVIELSSKRHFLLEYVLEILGTPECDRKFVLISQ